MFKKIAIVGVGLIGGSVGLAIKKKRIAREIIGICRRASSARKAIRKKAVDKVTLSMAEGLREADFVIVAAPMGRTANLAATCAAYMKKGAILTDVASSKRKIVKDIEKKLPRGIQFVSSHPMAGSEKAGVQYADAGLFKNASVILARTKKTDKKSINKLKKFWSALGAKVFILTPEKHDQCISRVSHLPHAASASLILSQDTSSMLLSAGGLKDITRISSSDPEMWADIFLTADKDLRSSISIFSKKLKTLEKAVREKNRKQLIRLLTKAKNIRDNIK